MKQDAKDTEAHARTLLNTEVITRPARCALFVDVGAATSVFGADLRAAVTTITREVVTAWGGATWILVPFDGKDLTSRQWAILSYFDPDHFACHGFTLADLIALNNAQALQRVDQEKEALQRAGFSPQSAGDYLERFVSEPWTPEWATNEKPGEFFTQEFLASALARCSPFHHQHEGVFLLEHVFVHRDWQPRTPIISSTSIARHAQGVTRLSMPKLTTRNELAELLMACYLGTTPSTAQVSAYRSAGIDVVEEPLGEYEAARLVALADRTPILEGSPRYPMQMSCSGLQSYHWRRESLPFEMSSQLVIVVGKTIADFLLYYNLSRMRSGVLWISTLCDPQQLDWLRLVVLDRRNMPDVKRLFVLSESIADQDAFDVVRATISKWRADGDRYALRGVESLTPSPVSADLREVLVGRRRFGTLDPPTRLVVPCQYEQSMVSVSAPVPKILSGLPNLECSWVVDYVHAQYLPPASRGISELLVQSQSRVGPRRDTGDLRWSRDGETQSEPAGLLRSSGRLEYEVSSTMLSRPVDEKLFTAVLSTHRLELAISDKGRYLNEVLALFGGLDECVKWFTDAKCRQLLEQFMKPKNKTPPSAKFINRDSRNVLPLAAFAAVFGASVRSVLTDLVKCGVVELGMILYCERCCKVDWYRLEAIARVFRCDHCGHVQMVLPSSATGDGQPLEPVWYYRLSEMVFQLLRHNGMCTVLALGALKRSGRGYGAFHYTPEVVISAAGTAIGEVDFIASMNGQLVLGECKTPGDGRDASLALKEIAKYTSLSAVLRPRSIVFACLGPGWAKATIDSVHQSVPYSSFMDSSHLIAHKQWSME